MCLKHDSGYCCAAFITTFTLTFGFFTVVFSQDIRDSSSYKNSVRLDFVPLYDDFFDTRVQIRAGGEYERSISERSAVSAYLDLGLYDKYDYIKYYNFFGQNQGMYSEKQRVSIIGFHFIPGYSYFFYTFRKKPNRKFFSSALVDCGYYHKSISYSNTLTSDGSSDSYDQMKVGAGLGVGFKNNFGKRLFYELKTSIVALLYNHVSKAGFSAIRALDAQWTSADRNFWGTSNIKIGYAF